MPNELKPRIDDLAASLGVPAAAILTGLPEALKVWDTFVNRMPKRLLDPVSFRLALANNVELLYNMMEMAGLALGRETVNLRDELESAEAALEEKSNEHLDLMYKLSLAMPARIWCMDSGNGGDTAGYVSEEPDDLPSWKVTVDLPNHTLASVIVSHADMARLFGHVQVTEVDPDPGYGGLGSSDTDGDMDEDHAGDRGTTTGTDDAEFPL
jgi:hypothetical protein